MFNTTEASSVILRRQHCEATGGEASWGKEKVGGGWNWAEEKRAGGRTGPGGGKDGGRLCYQTQCCRILQGSKEAILIWS